MEGFVGSKADLGNYFYYVDNDGVIRSHNDDSVIDICKDEEAKEEEESSYSDAENVNDVSINESDGDIEEHADPTTTDTFVSSAYPDETSDESSDESADTTDAAVSSAYFDESSVENADAKYTLVSSVPDGSCDECYDEYLHDIETRLPSSESDENLTDVFDSSAYFDEGYSDYFDLTDTRFSSMSDERHDNFDSVPLHRNLFDPSELQIYEEFAHNLYYVWPILDPSANFVATNFDTISNSSYCMAPESSFNDYAIIDNMFLDFIARELASGDRQFLILDENIALGYDDLADLASPVPFLASERHIDAFFKFRMEHFPDFIQESVHICSASGINLNIEKLDQWPNSAPLRILQDALDIHLRDVDFNLIPLLYQEHWTLAIVCGLGKRKVLSVDFELPASLHVNSAYGGPRIETPYAYAISRTVAKRANSESKTAPWHELHLHPFQPNSTDCGFFVMRFAVEFIKNLYNTHTMLVQDLFATLMEDPSWNESIEVAEKAKAQLKGYIASIPKEDLKWEDDYWNEIKRMKKLVVNRSPYYSPIKIKQEFGS